MATYGTAEWVQQMYNRNYYKPATLPTIQATARRVTTVNNTNDAINAQAVAMQPYYDRLRAYRYSTPELYNPQTNMAYKENGVPMENPYAARLQNAYMKQLSDKYGR